MEKQLSRWSYLCKGPVAGKSWHVVGRDEGVIAWDMKCGGQRSHEMGNGWVLGNDR